MSIYLTTKKIIKTGRDTTGENLTVKDVDPVKLANLKKEWEELPEPKPTWEQYKRAKCRKTFK